jgi:hypothetical protein
MKAKESQRANALAVEVAELKQQLADLQHSELPSPSTSGSNAHQVPWAAYFPAYPSRYHLLHCHVVTKMHCKAGASSWSHSAER